MTSEFPPLDRPEPAAPPHRDRLRDFARLITLVADQVDALRQRDIARLRELSEERARLESELHPAPEGDPDPAEGERVEPLPFPTEIAALLTEALAELDGFAREDREERDRWMVLEDDALRSLHVSRLRPLLGGQYVEFGSGDTHLDVRF